MGSDALRIAYMAVNLVFLLYFLNCFASGGDGPRMIRINKPLKVVNESTARGWFVLILGLVSFLSFLYAALISKLLPPSDNPFIAAIQRDRYYCFLVPLTVPVLFIAVYFHWLSMKLFKHA